MEHIGNLYNSLYRYFNALEQMGQYDRRETANLVIYLFIVNEIFEGNLWKHLKNEDLPVFERVLSCLYRGCLIDPVYENMKFKEPDLLYSSVRLRKSEGSSLRVTEESDPRGTERKY